MEGLLWLLVWGALFYFMMRFGCGSHMVHGGHSGHGSKPDSPGGHGSDGAAASPSKDPVCGMEVAPESGYSRAFNGREYRFCSRQCLDQFDADPSRYVR